MGWPASLAAEPSDNSRSLSPGSKTEDGMVTGNACVPVVEMSPLRCSSEKILSLKASTNKSVGGSHLSSTDSTSRSVPRSQLPPGDTGNCCAAPTSALLHKNMSNGGGEKGTTTPLSSSEDYTVASKVLAQSVRQTKTARDKEDHHRAGDLMRYRLNQADKRLRETGKVCDTLHCSAAVRKTQNVTTSSDTELINSRLSCEKLSNISSSSAGFTAASDSASPVSTVEVNLNLSATMNSAAADNSFTCPANDSFTCPVESSREQKGRLCTQSEQAETARERGAACTDVNLEESSSRQAPQSTLRHHQEALGDPKGGRTRVSQTTMGSAARSGKDYEEDQENASFTVDDRDQSCSTKKWQDGSPPSADHSADDWPGKVKRREIPCSGTAANINLSPISLPQVVEKQRNREVLHSNHLQQQVAALHVDGQSSTVTASLIEAATNAGTTGSAFGSPGSAYVESASTSSISTTSISRYVSTSLNAVPTFPVGPTSLSPEWLPEKKPSPSQSTRQSKFVVSSCKESPNFGLHVLPESIGRHLGLTQEQSGSTRASFETTLNSPVRPGDTAAAGRFSSAASPLLLEALRCLPVSPSASLRVSQPLSAGTKSRSFHLSAGEPTVAESAAANSLYLQDGTEEVSRLSGKDSPAIADLVHHTRGAILCSGSGSRSTLRTHRASCRHRTGRASPEHQTSVQEPNPADPLRKRVKPLQSQACVGSTSLTLSPDSHPLTSSSSSAVSPNGCEIEAASADQSETTHANKAVLPRTSRCAPRRVYSPQEKAAHKEASTLSEQSCLQETARQSSELVAEDRKEHYTSSPQQGPVETPSRNFVPQVELSCESNKKAELTLEPQLIPPQKEDLRMVDKHQEQQAFSCPSDVQLHASRTKPSTLECETHPKAEQAAFVLDELQQLQQLLGAGFSGGDSFPRDHLQRRFGQLLNALQQLLYTRRGGEHFSKERPQVRVRPTAQNSARCSNAFQALSECPPAAQLMPTYKSEEGVGLARVGQTREDAHITLSVDVVERGFPLENHIALVSDGDRVSDRRLWSQEGERELTDSMSSTALQQLSSFSAVDRPPSSSHLLVSTTRLPCVATSISGTQPKQLHAARAKVACLSGGVSTRGGGWERDPQLYVEERRAEGCTVMDCSASCTDSAGPLTGTRYRTDQVWLDISLSRKDFAANDKSDESVIRRAGQCSCDTFVLASSVDEPAARKEEGATQTDGAPVSSTSFSNTRKPACEDAIGSTSDACIRQPTCDSVAECQRPSTVDDETGSSPCGSILAYKCNLSNASASQAACDSESKYQYPSTTSSVTDSPQCSSVPGHEGDVRHRSITIRARTQKRDIKANQGCASSPIRKRSPATVSSTHCAHPEEPLSARVIGYKPLKGMRARRAKRSVCFRFKSRRRRSSGMRHIARGPRQSMPSGKTFISKTHEGAGASSNQQKVYPDAPILGLEMQECEAGGDRPLPAGEEKATPHSSEAGAVCSPFLKNGTMVREARTQEGCISTRNALCQDAETDDSRSTVRSSDKPSRTQPGEAKPSDSTSASTKDTQFMSTNRTLSIATEDGNDGAADTPDIYRLHQPRSTVMQVACRNEASCSSAASASSVNAELVQAVLSFVQRHLPTPQRKEKGGNEKDCLPASPFQLDVKKIGDSLPAEEYKNAHSGLLVASCLGVVAGCGGFSIFKDLCRLLNSITPEQTNEDGSQSAERIGDSRRGKGETVHTTTRLHDDTQNASAAVRKTTVPPGGWTAGRAATRVAQREHREHRMVEETEHLQSTSLASVLDRKTTRKKTACIFGEAPDADPSRQPCQTATRRSSLEGRGIRWELLRTAKRAVHRKERETNAEGDSGRNGHHNNNTCSAESHRGKQEGHVSTVSLLLTPRSNAAPSSKERSWCSSVSHLESDKAGGLSRSSVDNIEIQSTWSQLSATKNSVLPQQETSLQERKLSGEKRSEERVSAACSRSSLTDDEHFSREDLPSFDDIFNLPDLIPDAWYEEAEGSGRAGNCLNSGEGHSGQPVTKGCKHPGQWVLEHEASTLQDDTSAEGRNVRPGFFRMILEEKQRAAPSEVSLDQTPTADHTSQLPAVWNVPDDLVELIESVPGGSPSALRPPCALRLLPTSSSSSCSSQESTSRSASSSPSSVSSSASSSSPAASSPSRPDSGSRSPHAKEHLASKKAPITAEGNSFVKNSPFQMLTHQQRSPAAVRWIFESSSEYDGQSGDVESSQSECERMEETTCRSHDSEVEPSCEEDSSERGLVTANFMLNYAGPIGFFQRALAHERVRNKITHPLPEFVSLCGGKSSSPPFQRRIQSKRAKVRKKLCDRRSRTQPPPRGPSSYRPTKDQKRRRRHRREECLKQRLAALHRDNLSHEEYMGQFARRMSLTAVHKVFCIELTKAERCTLPCTNASGDVSIDEHINASSTRNNGAPAATAMAPWSASGGEPSPRSRTGAEGRLSTNEKCTTAAGTTVPMSPALTIEACIADQLRHRGWVMNRLLSDSHFFDLKWKLSDVDEDYRSLRREQFFNHFQNNRAITTKGGLARSFRRLAVEEQVPVDFFFPRCYHLSSLDECSDFLLDYSRCEAVTVLLAYLRCYQATPGEFHSAMVAEPLPSNSLRRSAALLVWMAYHIASIWLHELNPDSYLDRTDSIEQQGRLDPQRLEVFASHAWHFRSQTQAFLREWHAIAQCGKALCTAVHNNETLEEEAALSLVKEGGLFSWNTRNLSRAPLGSQILRLLKQLQMRWPLWQLERGVFNLEDLKASEEACRLGDDGVAGGEEELHQAEQNTRGNGENALESRIRDPCWKQHNVWIMKPSSNSKASGIHCLNNPWEILRAGRGLSDRLIQKYVEQPLLLPCQTKFDMRQWVLVRSFDPLRVYMFSKLYLRLCSEKYDLRDLQNRFRHVCNRHLNKLNTDMAQACGNSTAKDTNVYPAACGTYSGATGAAAGLDSCQPLAELEALLAKRTGNRHFFQENVMPQIRHIVLQTVRAARPFVTPRPNSFELYGFDILLDATYRAWLIEVNLSPACAASAKWQKQMVKQMTSGLVDLLFKDGATRTPCTTGGKMPDAGYWALVFDESVDPSEAVRVFPPVEPADKTLVVGYNRGCENPYLQFYSQPIHKRGGSSFAPRAAGGTAGMYVVNTRGDEKSKNLQVIGPAAASWDKMVVTGEHLPRQAETTLDAWCRFTEAKNRIIGWWRRSAWKRRAARRKRFSLYDDIEVDYFFSLV